MTLAEIGDILGAARYAEHAICLTNDPFMVWAYTASDILIFLSYVTIATSCMICWWLRIRLPMVAFTLFAAFILLCGLTHASAVVVLFAGIYRLDLILNIATAVVSAGTAAFTVADLFRSDRHAE